MRTEQEYLDMEVALEKRVLFLVKNTRIALDELGVVSHAPIVYLVESKGLFLSFSPTKHFQGSPNHACRFPTRGKAEGSAAQCSEPTEVIQALVHLELVE